MPFSRKGGRRGGGQSQFIFFKAADNSWKMEEDSRALVLQPTTLRMYLLEKVAEVPYLPSQL